MNLFPEIYIIFIITFLSLFRRLFFVTKTSVFFTKSKSFIENVVSVDFICYMNSLKSIQLNFTLWFCEFIMYIYACITIYNNDGRYFSERIMYFAIYYIIISLIFSFVFQDIKSIKMYFLNVNPYINFISEEQVLFAKNSARKDILTYVDILKITAKKIENKDIFLRKKFDKPYGTKK